MAGSRRSQVGLWILDLSSMFWFFLPPAGSIWGRDPPPLEQHLALWAYILPPSSPSERKKLPSSNSSGRSPGLSLTGTWVTHPSQKYSPWTGGVWGTGSALIGHEGFHIITLYSCQDSPIHQQVVSSIFQGTLGLRHHVDTATFLCTGQWFPIGKPGFVTANHRCYRWGSGRTWDLPEEPSEVVRISSGQGWGPVKPKQLTGQ